MWQLAHTGRFWITQFESALMFGPSIAFFLFLVLERIKTIEDRAIKVSVRCFVLAASLSPLLLHFVAYDSIRFDAEVGLTSFLAMVLVFERFGAPVDFLKPEWSYAALFLIALNMGTGISLMDEGVVPLFPQMKSLRYGAQDVLDILHHRPIELPSEPFKDQPWDPTRPTFSGALATPEPKK